MKFWKLASAATGLVLSASVNAALIDNGDYTTDTDTGLDWLDLTYTDGISYNEVNNHRDSYSGGGWSIASASQVVEMITNYLGYSPVQGWDTSNYPLHYLQVELFGITRSLSGSVASYTSGYTSDISTYPGPGVQGDHLTIQFGTHSQLYPEQGSYLYDTWGQPDTQGFDGIGTYLIRPAIIATPTPAAVWLFGSGLIGLVGFARRKKA